MARVSAPACRVCGAFSPFRLARVCWKVRVVCLFAVRCLPVRRLLANAATNDVVRTPTPSPMVIILGRVYWSCL